MSSFAARFRHAPATIGRLVDTPVDRTGAVAASISAEPREARIAARAAAFAGTDLGRAPAAIGERAERRSVSVSARRIGRSLTALLAERRGLNE